MGRAHLFAAGEPRSLLVGRAGGQTLAPMLPHDHAGHVLKPGQTLVKKIAAK